MIRVSRGDRSDCVAKKQNDLQEGFFFNRQGTFLVATALRLEKSGGRGRARSKKETARCSKVSFRGGSWASRRSREEGVEERHPVTTQHAALCRTSK